MQIPDIITMYINAGRSMIPIIELFAGICYVAGFVFVLMAFGTLHKIADRRSMYPSNEKGWVPLVYIVIGAGLIMLPDTINMLSNTLFQTNILTRARMQNPTDVIHAVSLLMKVIGLIWVLRGCVLLVGATHPGEQHGPKGLAFLTAGILCLNLESTISALNAIMSKVTHFFQ